MTNTIKLDLSKKYLITGGAGFIGSHLVERLLKEGCEITIYDNLSTGTKYWLEQNPLWSNLTFIQADLRNKETLNKAIAGHDVAFHLAAYADTQKSGVFRDADLQNGTIATWNLLEAMHSTKSKTSFLLQVN